MGAWFIWLRLVGAAYSDLAGLQTADGLGEIAAGAAAIPTWAPVLRAGLGIR